MKKFIILLLIISGCKHSLKEERESYIGMSDKTYWRMIRSDVPKDTTIGICFLKNGTYEGYRIIKTSGKRIMSETHHDVKFVESEWSIPNDSTMIFGQNVPYHIVFFTKV